MGTLSVNAGFRFESAIEQLVIVGRSKLLKSLKYEGELAKKLSFAGVESPLFEKAIQRLTPSCIMPLYLNSVKIISVPDDVSRHNSPSNSYSIFKAFKEITSENNSKKLHIVLYSNYEHVLASYSAIVKSFPLYSRKTFPSADKKIFQHINIDIISKDKNLSEADVLFLQDLGESIRFSSKLIDTPCNELHTEAFVDEAVSLINKISTSKIQTTLIKGDDLKTQGFGGIYHVGKAATNPPIFLCFSHTPIGAKETYALVGKGIVFDTGGMQIKSKTAMPTMKIDMGGAAVVLSSFYTLVRSGFSQNLHCLLCLAENNISPMASKPDDIINLLSGKSVEISNTDAEGRLVLADGVFYAKTMLNASTIIDVATLTGAQRYATGKVHAAILANTDELEIRCINAGRKSGDLVHPLPFAPDIHLGDLKSVVADLKNANNEPGCCEGPPSSIAGLFIGTQINFGIDEKGNTLTNWLHVDLASPAFVGERATSFGVSLLCSLLSKDVQSNIANI